MTKDLRLENLTQKLLDTNLYLVESLFPGLGRVYLDGKCPVGTSGTACQSPELGSPGMTLCELCALSYWS